MPENKSIILDWLSFHWFNPETLLSFEWDNIFYLYFIPTIPFLFILRWIFHVRFRQKLDIALPIKQVKKWNFIAWLRFIPIVLFMLFTSLILVSLARPQHVNEKVEHLTEGIDIIIALDISESMELEDFKPNRLEASKKVAEDFIKEREHDRIGLVIFAGQSFALAPLTTDYDLLQSNIKDINFRMIEEGGTAIGNALITSINRMRETNAKSKVIILLSDGENTAGNIDPIAAAKLAYAYNIKVYTIGIGRNGKIPYGKTDGNTQYVVSSLDETTLRQIAFTAQGKFFRASNNNMLRNIFDMINQYEKGEIKETRYKDNEDYYHIYLTWAIIVLLTWLALRITFISNALED